MTREVIEMVILVADDDEGHIRLLEKNLKRAGLRNDLLRFENGQDILDFLFCRNATQTGIDISRYLLLIDIRMPKIDGIEVIRRIKADCELCKLPVIMLTTTDHPRETSHCEQLGCSYIFKPVDFEKFSNTIKELGLFISLVQTQSIKSI